MKSMKLFIHPSMTYIFVTFLDPVSQNVWLLKVILDILMMNSTISVKVLFVIVNLFCLNKGRRTEVVFLVRVEVFSNTQPQNICFRHFYQKRIPIHIQLLLWILCSVSSGFA